MQILEYTKRIIVDDNNCKIGEMTFSHEDNTIICEFIDCKKLSLTLEEIECIYESMKQMMEDNK